MNRHVRRAYQKYTRNMDVTLRPTENAVFNEMMGEVAYIARTLKCPRCQRDVLVMEVDGELEVTCEPCGVTWGGSVLRTAGAA